MPPRHPKKKKSKPRQGQHQKSARRKTTKSRTASPAPKRPGELFENLVALQARLRAPGGCPWDREQTHHTLKTFLIEEAYEVLEALDQGDAKELAEELGDLLLQILFHADIAREAGRFDIADVISGIHDKMVRRHPHVFGTVKADTSEQVLKNWALPRSLPALMEAHQLTRRAAQVGFDWETVEGIFTKLREEIAELRVALNEADRERREEEIGDLLFVVVNLARFLGFDPEVALKHSNLKFKSRFKNMEEEATRSGQRLAQLSKEELEVLWEAAKRHERMEATREPGS